MHTLTHTIWIHYNQLVFHRTPKWNSPGYWWEDKPSERRPGIDNTINGCICTQSIQMSRGVRCTERGEVWCERSVLTSASSALNKPSIFFGLVFFLAIHALGSGAHCKYSVVQSRLPPFLCSALLSNTTCCCRVLVLSGSVCVQLGEGVSRITTPHCWFCLCFFFSFTFLRQTNQVSIRNKINKMYIRDK